MKIIHTADLHIDSRIKGLSPEKAAVRRRELILTFGDIVNYAKSVSAAAVLICGDLFDSKPSIKAGDEVISIFLSAPDIDFFVLAGNHDNSAFSADFCKQLPTNVKLFGDGFKRYDRGDVSIYGSDVADRDLLDGLTLDGERVNIVMLHTAVGDKPSELDISAMDKPIDYLALGHYHSYAYGGAFRGVYVMCGTPEGRGFDETGEKGFVEIDIDGKTVKQTFIRSCKRRYFDVSCDVSDKDIYSAMRSAVKDYCIKRDDILRITLDGKSKTAHIDSGLLASRLTNEGLVFAVKVVDNTGFVADTGRISLYNEFKALVEKEITDERKKQEVLRYGYLAICDEEIDTVDV